MNQFYNNQFQNPYGVQQYMPTQVKQPAMTQPLSKEEMNELSQMGKFDLTLSPLDIQKAKCTHKRDGKIVLQQTADHKLYCPICKESFSEQQLSDVEVCQSIENVIDILQTIKTYYVDIPMEVAANYFSFIPLLRKAVEMYKIACDNFNSHENANMLNTNQFNQGVGFNAYQALLAPTAMPMMMPGMGMPNMQQPMMGMPMQQPMQQPMMGMPGMGMPGMQNAFGVYPGMVDPNAMAMQQQQMNQPVPTQQTTAAPANVTVDKAMNA